MKNNIFIIFILIVNLYLHANQVTLFGKIYDENTLEAIPDASISIGARKVKSNKDGYYFINRLDFGIIILEVRAKNHIPFTTTITLDNKKTRYDVALKPAIVKIKPPAIQRPTIKKPIIPTVSKPILPKPPEKIKSKITHRPVETNEVNLEELAIPENYPIQNSTEKNKENVFLKAKQLIDNGQFLESLPLWYQVYLMGNVNERLKSCYYISIIYKTQKLYNLELDYLYKTMGLAYETKEDLAFINQLKMELAETYSKLDKVVLSNLLIKDILKNTDKNFPLTNFNAYQFLANKAIETHDFSKAKKYLELATNINVKPSIKQKASLLLVDIHISEEKFETASKILNKLKNSYQSQETEKREYLLSALKKNQTYIQKGDLDAIISSVIPALKKALNIDPDYHIARAYLANIEFMIGKLMNKLDYVINAKKHVERLKTKVPDFIDQSGKKPAELLEEINKYLNGL